MAALALASHVSAIRANKSTGQKSTAPPRTPVRRFQGDAQWQRDFARLNRLAEEMAAHVIAGHQLLEYDAEDAARYELELADDDWAVIECLIHALTYMDDRPC